MNHIHSFRSDVPDHQEDPWQLKLFRRTLKKQQKLKSLLKLIGPLTDRDTCILVTCGDNNGALNWHFKAHGGSWSWADAEPESSFQIGELTGDHVLTIDKESPQFNVADQSFDVVVTIDIHEHLCATNELNQELARIVKENGRIIVTTPGGDQRKLANKIKNWIGMSTRDYGHVVDGYTCDQLSAQLQSVNLTPVVKSSYSKFFTEMVELAINFAYVKVLARRSAAPVEAGQIAPQSQDQLKSVEKTYRLYSLIYPFIWLISRLDILLPFAEGYAAIVMARKEA
ncbi:MAG: methyltransferase domain-containing protein [Anaerolineales bacterium]|nr:methyltransferase domain-containing protein [Anaerolineales bacterium]MCA9928687.1 methyltransferase domain-containing protein [Anaerolineales bacterium]